MFDRRVETNYAGSARGGGTTTMQKSILNSLAAVIPENQRNADDNSEKGCAPLLCVNACSH